MPGSTLFFKGHRKFSNGHCDKIHLQIFFILISINIKVLFIFHTKFRLNVPLEKMTILIVLLFLVTAAILNS